MLRFLELVAVMEPGRLPKTDKAAILSDAARILTQLRGESSQLKETIHDLQAKVKELKVRGFGKFNYSFSRNISLRTETLQIIVI